MRSILLIIALTLMPFHCSAEDKLQEICKSKNNEEKYVIDLYHDGIFCTLDEYLAVGNECESRFAYDPQIEYMVDINNDKNPDIIFSFTAKGGPWHECYKQSQVFVNCGNNIFINMLDLCTTSLRAYKFNKKTGWVTLKGTFERLMENGDSLITYEEFDFDKKSFSYIATYSEKERIKTELDDLRLANEKYLPSDPRTYLLKFPKFQGEEPIPEIRPTSPSFNCAKAATQIEKIICADTDLIEADKLLSDDFRKLNSTLKDGQKEKLLTEQKAWLKQRNECNTSSCLLWLYSNKINELRYRIRYNLETPQ
jgi:uncharacterized protein YecT (DUF1311 family)